MSDPKEEIVLCILCDKQLMQKDSCTVKERAIASLIDASKQRKDKKHLQFRGMKSLNIHKSCQTLYSRKSNIDAALNKSKTSVTKVRRRSSDARSFDFSTLCFICGSEVSKNSPVSLVQTDDVRLKVLDRIQNMSDEQKKESTDFYASLSARLINVTDLSLVGGRYHRSCFKHFYKDGSSSNAGRPNDGEVSSAVNFVINYILENDEECQFSLKEILLTYDGEISKLCRIKEYLEAYFGNDLLIYQIKNDYILCFRDSSQKVADDFWFQNRAKNEADERVRIVDMAANIILQDIRSQFYDMQHYNSPSNFFVEFEKNIPSSLKLFLDILIKSHKRKNSKDESEKKWSNRVTTVSHILISSVRPRQFLSPLLLGLSSMIHKKYAARGLIDALSYLGLCSSYSETLLFESSIVNDPEHYSLVGDHFVQFVFDNADHNTKTIDGHNTFHAMGGIMCVTPSSSVQSNKTVKRLNQIPPADVMGKFGFVPLKHFNKGNSLGLQNVKVEDISLLNAISDKCEIDFVDFLWLYGKNYKPLDTAGWSGLLENYYKSDDSETSKIIPLPFVNAPPSNYDTILTVLIEAALRCKANGQKTCFVTFDQPLYLKAREILACTDFDVDENNLKSVVLRLGGFHMLMSFLGSIGFTMEGSGLKEALSTIYAGTSAEKALTGHAFSRAVRGHLLIQATLAGIVLSSLNLNENEVEILNNVVTKVGEDNFENVHINGVLEIKNRFENQLEVLKQNGPTSKLWLQYYEMVAIAKKFIAAERSGNWQQHLECVQRMLPYFHSSGHCLYAKCSQLYLQDMIKLKPNVNMDLFEFDKFFKSGYFTIRRSQKFWCGVWSDMTIEQVLMRSMKSSGGLTHGRGITDNVLTKWILSSIILTEVSNEVENFCNVSYKTSEQHVDTRVSRISRDKTDLEKLKAYFTTYDPFPITDKIMSIYSGVIGDKRINCFEAFEIGVNILKKIVNQDYGTIKLQRKDKVLSLKAVNSSIKIDDETITINPLLLFQRISLNVEKKDDMKDYLKYELAPFPLSLFDESGMRKTTNSAFYDNFKSIRNVSSSGNILHVVDGGFLIHRVLWHQNDQIEQILNQYVSDAKKYYAANSYIIFDGYPDEETASRSTKSYESLRRKNRNIGREVIFDNRTKINFSQDNFLSNDKNKKNLIVMLCEELKKSGFRTKIAEANADVLIIKTAMEIAADNVVINVVGQDIDLLVLFTQFVTDDKKVFFIRCGTGRASDEVFSTLSFKHEKLKSIILFLHAFTGCDTTSSFFKQGKSKLIKLMNSNESLQVLAKNFYNKDAETQSIRESGNKIIAAMYTMKQEENLHELRFLHFQKSSLNSNFKLENLPPTEGAATQHSFRVYFQIQDWLGNAKDALHWGWKLTTNGLRPVYTCDPLIPDDLIKKITCKCTTGCKAACGCRKHGLHCSDLCSGCQGVTCTNVEMNLIECMDDDIDSAVNTENAIELAAELIDDESEKDDCLELETVPCKRRKIH